MSLSEKQLLRQRIRQARKTMSVRARNIASKKVCQRLLPLIGRGKTIAVYRATGSELDLSFFIHQAMRRGARIIEPQPVLRSSRTRRMWMIHWGSAWCRTTRKMRIERASVIILPLIGVDFEGYRLGQGGGFYDASLSAAHRLPRLVGVGFECQIVHQVPREQHDIPLNDFVYPDCWIKFTSSTGSLLSS